MTNQLVIMAQIKPKPQYYDDAKTAIKGIVSKTRNEPGCREFKLNEGVEDDCLYLYEEWDHQNALDEHYAQPYVAQVFASYKHWLDVPVDIKKLSKVS